MVVATKAMAFRIRNLRIRAGRTRTRSPCSSLGRGSGGNGRDRSYLPLRSGTLANSQPEVQTSPGRPPGPYSGSPNTARAFDDVVSATRSGVSPRALEIGRAHV